jgi:hypothetical protein
MSEFGTTEEFMMYIDRINEQVFVHDHLNWANAAQIHVPLQ